MTIKALHLCSGWGTTMQSAAGKANNGELGDIRSVMMLGSKPWIGALKKASDLDISRTACRNPKNSKELIHWTKKMQADMVFANGWLPKIPEEFIQYCRENSIILFNQHPGTLREDRLDFWGDGELGMYGSRVTAARVKYLLNTKIQWEEHIFTESTIHHIERDVDRGLPVSIEKYNFTDIM